MQISSILFGLLPTSSRPYNQVSQDSSHQFGSHIEEAYQATLQLTSKINTISNLSLDQNECCIQLVKILAKRLLITATSSLLLKNYSNIIHSIHKKLGQPGERVTQADCKDLKQLLKKLQLDQKKPCQATRISLLSIQVVGECQSYQIGNQSWIEFLPAVKEHQKGTRSWLPKIIKQPSKAQNSFDYQQRWDYFFLKCLRKETFSFLLHKDFIERALNDYTVDRLDLNYSLMHGRQKRYLSECVRNEIKTASLTVKNEKIVSKKRELAAEAHYQQCVDQLDGDLILAEKVMKLTVGPNRAILSHMLSGLFSSAVLGIDCKTLRYKVRISKFNKKIFIALSIISQVVSSPNVSPELKAEDRRIYAAIHYTFDQEELRLGLVEHATASFHLDVERPFVNSHSLSKEEPSKLDKLIFKVLVQKDPRSYKVIANQLLNCHRLDAFNSLCSLILPIKDFWEFFFDRYPAFLSRFSEAEVGVAQRLKELCSAEQWRSKALWLPPAEALVLCPLAAAIRSRNKELAIYLCKENPLEDKSAIYQASQKEFRGLLEEKSKRDSELFDTLLEFFPESMAYAEQGEYHESAVDSSKRIGQGLSAVSLIANGYAGQLVVEELVEGKPRRRIIGFGPLEHSSRHDRDWGIKIFTECLGKAEPGRVQTGKLKSAEIRKDESATWIRAAATVERLLDMYLTIETSPLTHPLAYYYRGSKSQGASSQKMFKINNATVRELFVLKPELIIATYYFYKYQENLWKIKNKVGVNYNHFSSYFSIIRSKSKCSLTCSSDFQIESSESKFVDNVKRELINDKRITPKIYQLAENLSVIRDSIEIVRVLPHNCWSLHIEKLLEANIHLTSHWTQMIATWHYNVLSARKD